MKLQVTNIDDPSANSPDAIFACCECGTEEDAILELHGNGDIICYPCNITSILNPEDRYKIRYM